MERNNGRLAYYPDENILSYGIVKFLDRWTKCVGKESDYKEE
jgi:hypothetical protein